MSERRDDLLDETILRRALRLDDDERGPAFDTAAIAAMARYGQLSPRAFALVLFAAAISAVVAVAVWSIVFVLAPDVVDDLLSAAMPGVVTVGTIFVSIAEIAAQPVVPLSLIAALGVAILHSVRERREYAHAHAS